MMQLGSMVAHLGQDGHDHNVRGRQILVELIQQLLHLVSHLLSCLYRALASYVCTVGQAIVRSGPQCRRQLVT